MLLSAQKAQKILVIAPTAVGNGHLDGNRLPLYYYHITFRVRRQSDLFLIRAHFHYFNILWYDFVILLGKRAFLDIYVT